MTKHSSPSVQRWHPFSPQTRPEEHNIIDVASRLTGDTPTTTVHNVVANRKMYKTLRAELTKEFPLPKSELGFQKLEQLPYLISLIFCFHVALHTNRRQELLSYGVLGMLPCVVPESGAEFNGYNVPAGTIVSTSSWMMHRDEKLFPAT
ncbi:hypothetical protein PAAG_01848 [Paracoccidioides lutzii Pb01]|uniref:Uncharacterized protein n=1 Tax=Paracoccidioides lutzii (strain ATCC MYA-826 / Pb01) TaxID=502779 RepID=C1GTK3_PARBA|nr:hypothetical protein PAAG_01848 [Paracoccidioides lutzii Pb01]EEH39659.2 hypothetical protein PAAG_01848 [Paracoccidioides lutzii Pb01]